MRHILSNVGFDISVASNGRVAVELALQSLQEKNPYDVVFMDLDMPVMNGFNAVKTLREEGYDRIIIALTANETIKTHQKCREVGFDDYAKKPISKPDLQTLFERHLR